MRALEHAVQRSHEADPHATRAMPRGEALEGALPLQARQLLTPGGLLARSHGRRLEEWVNHGGGRRSATGKWRGSLVAVPLQAATAAAETPQQRSLAGTAPQLAALATPPPSPSAPATRTLSLTLSSAPWGGS